MIMMISDDQRLCSAHVSGNIRCKEMIRRLDVNKSACAVFVALVVVILLLFHHLTDKSSPFSSDATGSVYGDLNYGVIIDAGSTGSRLFLYGWRSSSPYELIDIKPVNDYLNRPVVKKVTPGLSIFGDRPEMAAEYIRPLLDYAAQFVDPNKHSSTPVFIFATAGMRLLSLAQQNAVMNALHKDLPAKTRFQIVPANIQVISGKWEGTYSWIAVNYMLGRFHNAGSGAGEAATRHAGDFLPLQSDTQLNDARARRPATAGMIDMGGASAQIAFELPPQNDFSENVHVINLGGHADEPRFLYKLFVTTFLGFGANEGAKMYEDLLLSKLRALYDASAMTAADADGGANSTIVVSSAAPAVEYMRDGCMPRDFLKLVTKNDGRQFVRKGTGLWDDCVSDLTYLLFHGPHVAACPPTKKCFFGGVVAPDGVSLSDIELFGFSEYWFSVEDVLALGGVYNHDEFETKAKAFCRQSWTEIQRNVKAKMYPHADEERLQTQCFKSAWIHAVLHNGFFVDEKRHHFQSSFKINGEEVQWALGAMIYHMRHFPLTAARASGILTARSNAGWLSNSSAGWTYFYLLAVLMLLYLLYVTVIRNKNALAGVGRAQLIKKSSSVPSEFTRAREFYRDV